MVSLSENKNNGAIVIKFDLFMFYLIRIFTYIPMRTLTLQ